MGQVLGSYDFDASDLSVIFTNMATGRKTIAPNVEALPDIAVDVTFPLVPDQMYLVEVVGKNTGGGILPLPFYPFTYDIVSEDYIASTTRVDGVNVQFVKVFHTYNEVFSSTEQWVSI